MANSLPAGQSSALAKLDPTLMLGAMRAPWENHGIIARDIETRPTSLTRIRGMNFGIQSLAAQMSSVLARRFIADDLVQVLVDSTSATNVVEAITAWNGTAQSLTTTTVSARMPRQRLIELAMRSDVRYIEASTKLKIHCDQAHLSARLVKNGIRTVAQTGKGVLVGVIDTGIDVEHPAFKVSGKTRIVNYLDQESNEEFDADAINNGDAVHSIDTIGHGTHVAGIAAGNGDGSPDTRLSGLAYNADLAIVKTTFNSADIVAAVQHIFALAERYNQPCVVNLSLGGHSGGHDGSSVTERTIDQLSGVGRLVVVSAGNEGNDPIHASTVLNRSTLTPDRWVADIRLNPRIFETPQGPKVAGLLSVQLWHQQEDQVTIELRSPNGDLFSAPVGGQNQFDHNVFFVEASHQRNVYSGDHVTSFLIITDAVPRWLGGWSIIAQDDRNSGGIQVGTIHAWIQDNEQGQFTSGATRSHLVGMPGTAYSAITVASYATRNAWSSRDPNNSNDGTFLLPAINVEEISQFSSIGPTREGHNKPDIAAPGQFLLAPLSKDAVFDEIPEFLRVKGHEYAAMQGTSMAAPYVTGALALLLEKDGDIDWSEAKRRLMKAAIQDLHTTPCWNPRWGYGKLNVEWLLNIEPG